MRRALVVCSLFQIGGVGAGYSAAGSQAPVTGSEWDFGYLPQKTEVDHVFFLYNVGEAPMSVKKIKAGCSCTSVSKIDRPIPPGDSAAVTITFKSGRYYGRVKKTSEVHTDSPGQPLVKLRVVAHVVKEGEPAGSLSVSPQRLVWKIDDGRLATIEDTVEILNTGSDTTEIVLVHEPQALIERVTVPDRLAPGEKGEVIVRSVEASGIEEGKGPSLRLTFLASDTTRVTIPVELKD